MGDTPLSEVSHLSAAVIGTGFIGGVHVQMLRRAGVTVRGVLGSSPERGVAGAASHGVPHAYATLDELLADDVDAVHVTTPNYAHCEQVKAILAAGKHVICEKPLAMTSAQSAEMAALAAASGKVCAVCYNIRFYPLNQHAHAMVKAGGVGAPKFVTGHYHQDWLAEPTDWNWRVDSEKGGALRSVGDIGTHWVDLTSFVTGLEVEAVMAELVTVHAEREKPEGGVETFSGAQGHTVKVSIDTDDASMILRHGRCLHDPDPLQGRRTRCDEHKPDQPRAKELPYVGCGRRERLPRLGQRDARPSFYRAPQPRQRDPDARLHPHERDGHPRSDAAARPC